MVASNTNCSAEDVNGSSSRTDVLSCPRCESELLHRSRRYNTYEHILGMVGVRPYRCEACNERFYSRKKPG